ncbi:hypothetical protein [Caballeronia terrestris]|nr:hypothetical protein [Caballeronia terrestris]
MLIVASVIVVALGAFMTFTIADLLSPDVLAKNEEHGRFAHLGTEADAVPVNVRERAAAASRPTRRPVRAFVQGNGSARRALRHLTR